MKVYIEERSEDVHGKEEVSGKGCERYGCNEYVELQQRTHGGSGRGRSLQSQPAACGGLQASLAECLEKMRGRAPKEEHAKSVALEVWCTSNRRRL